MLYLTATNYDQCEGRGWQVPTLITRERNVALWFAYTTKPFYDRVQEAYQLNFGDLYRTKTDFIKTYPKTQVADETLNAAWEDYMTVTLQGNETLPAPKLNVETVYLVGHTMDASIGGTVYHDKFFPTMIVETYVQAKTAALQLATDGQDYHVIAVDTDTNYGTGMYDRERIFSTTKPELMTVAVEALNTNILDKAALVAEFTTTGANR